MPVLNGAGELIQERKMTQAEFERIRWLSGIKYPVDKIILVHMKPSTFKEWLFQLPMKEALIISSEKDFIELRSKVLSKNLFVQAFDYLWRLINGHNH